MKESGLYVDEMDLEVQVDLRERHRVRESVVSQVDSPVDSGGTEAPMWSAGGFQKQDVDTTRCSMDFQRLQVTSPAPFIRLRGIFNPQVTPHAFNP